MPWARQGSAEGKLAKMARTAGSRHRLSATGRRDAGRVSRFLRNNQWCCGQKTDICWPLQPRNDLPPVRLAQSGGGALLVVDRLDSVDRAVRPGSGKNIVVIIDYLTYIIWRLRWPDITG